MSKKKLNFKTFFTILTVMLGLYPLHHLLNANADSEGPGADFEIGKVREKITEKVINTARLPDELEVNGRKTALGYTINTDLDSFVRKQLKSYSPDYASVVVIDNDNGNILSAVDFDRKKNNFGMTMTFSSEHPAASIFKVVTAAELIRGTRLDKDSMHSFLGRSTTLFKYQLRDQGRWKWRRFQTLEEAFAVSNNVIFAKLAMEHLQPKDLSSMANNFGFNQFLMNDITLPRSQFVDPANEFEMAEYASGYNVQTMMSPVHGAVISSIIANDGVMRKPHLLASVLDSEKKEMVWLPTKTESRVLELENAKEMQELMQATVKSGTAKRAFRKAKRVPFDLLEIGGKTGSITGGVPYGKRDWFVSYARPTDRYLGNGISICVMIVNVKRWKVKSTFVAKNIIEHYYKNLFPLKKYQNITSN